MNPRDLIRDENDARFCEYVAHGADWRAASLAAYGREIESVEHARLKKRKEIKDYIAYLQRPGHEIATDVLRGQLVSPKATERVAAATKLLDRHEKKGAQEAVARWWDLLEECGYTIRLPVPPSYEFGHEVEVTLAELRAGRAYVDDPLAAKVALLHRAGAPWNQHDPDAKLSELQIELLGREERELICHGGSGVGKSVLGGCFALLELIKPHREIAIVADTYDHCSDEFQYVHAGFRKLFGRYAVKSTYVNTRSVHDMEIQTYWQSRIRTFSVDREEGDAILGKEFDLIVLGEGSKVSEDVLNRKCKRAVDRRVKMVHGHYRRTGRTVIFTTPAQYSGCSAAEFERVKKATRGRPERLHAENADWLESVYLREANCLENPSYSKEVFESRRKSLPADIFSEQYEGKMMRRAGLIYKEFSAERDIVPFPPPEQVRRMRLGVGIDTGKNFAAILVGMDPDRVLWVLGEAYTFEQSITDNAEDLKEMAAHLLSPSFWGKNWDYVGPLIDVWRIDPSSQHKEDLGPLLDVPITFDQLDLLPTIDVVRKMMREGRVRFCEEGLHDPLEGKGILWEIGRYQWKEPPRKATGSRSEQLPAGKDDHGLDALRFVAVPMEEIGPLEGEARQAESFEKVMRDRVRYEVVGHLVERMRRPNLRNPGEAFRAVHGPV